MRRTSRWLCVLLSAVMTVGCQKPYFMTDLDYDFYNRVSGEYDRSEYGDEPLVPVHQPRTVRDPGETDKIPWKLTLAEVKRITLENNKQIAFLGYRPGEAGTVVDLRLSAFDAFFSFGGAWSGSEQQVLSNIQVIGTGRDAITQKLFGGAQAGYGFNATQGAATQEVFSSIPGAEVLGIFKRNATGGLTRLTYTLDYQNINPVNVFTAINPAWRSAVNIGLEQPVLQGAGVEFNRAPILIARANYEQQIKDFQANVQTLLRDVEIAYWQINFAYQDLYSRQTGMEQALATWQKEKNKQEVGTGAVPDVAQAREQYEFFRAARLQALTRVLAAERDLRRLMGLPPDDDRRIIPADDPVIAEYAPNWQIAIQETMEFRPELAGQRFLVRAAELEVLRQKNGLLPDLTLAANYSITGLADDWDQSINVLTDSRFTVWTLGGRYRQQIGERAAHAAVRRANLALSRERATLRNLEHTYLCDLHEAYQNIISFYDLIQVQKDRREAATQQLEAREQFYRQGKTTIDVLLQAQTAFADALRDEGQAIVQYNQALARWEFAKGTILFNDNVALVEEGVSRMKSKTLDQRRRSWMHGLPLPYHPGTKVHGDLIWCPNTFGPLYPSYLLATPPEEGPAAIEGSAPAGEGAPASPVAPQGPTDSGPAIEPSSPRPMPKVSEMPPFQPIGKLAEANDPSAPPVLKSLIPTAQPAANPSTRPPR